AGSLAPEFLADDGVDGPALGSALELRHHLPHHRADVRRAARDRRAHRGANLLGIDLRGKILLQQRDLGALLVREVLSVALVVHLDRLTALLNPSTDYLYDIAVV